MVAYLLSRMTLNCCHRFQKLMTPGASLSWLPRWMKLRSSRMKRLRPLQQQSVNEDVEFTCNEFAGAHLSIITPGQQRNVVAAATLRSIWQAQDIQPYTSRSRDERVTARQTCRCVVIFRSLILKLLETTPQIFDCDNVSKTHISIVSYQNQENKTLHQPLRHFQNSLAPTAACLHSVAHIIVC